MANRIGAGRRRRPQSSAQKGSEQSGASSARIAIGALIAHDRIGGDSPRFRRDFANFSGFSRYGGRRRNSRDLHHQGSCHETKIACRVALLGVVALAARAQPVRADAVVDWNEITVAAVTAGRPGPIGLVDIALVQIAVHDAVQAIEQRYEPYHAEIPEPTTSKAALRGRGRGSARRARRHVSRAGGDARHHLLQLPCQQRSDGDPASPWASRSPRAFFRCGG